MSEFSETVSAYIQRWLSEAPNRSLHLLSGKSRVSYSTCQRAKEGHEIGIDKAIQILGVVCKKEEVVPCLAKEYPGTFLDTPEVVVNTDELDWGLLDDPFTNRVYALIGSGNTTKDELNHMFGKLGLMTVNKLEKYGLVCQDEFSVWLPVENHRHTVPMTLHNIRCRAEDYDISRLGRHGAWVTMFTQRVDKHTLVEIQKLTREYILRVSELMKERSGDLPLFASTLGNLMNDSEVE
jgi:hypothetical protein